MNFWGISHSDLQAYVSMLKIKDGEHSITFYLGIISMSKEIRLQQDIIGKNCGMHMAIYGGDEIVL